MVWWPWPGLAYSAVIALDGAALVTADAPTGGSSCDNVPVTTLTPGYRPGAEPPRLPRP
jgi:hypothetical protein